ncbi:O-antigen ligase family protein [Knoellia koreensis]|uniref:O-antigen ligase family protein n=1 Tax=Knoellia koreensis TaxID=2730921 RepID=A0A849HU80_9MICO|nr:O-antigen ligase family protein [Knoellia sp. DB2414S]
MTSTPAPRRDGSVVALVVACLLVAAEFSGAYGVLDSMLPFSGFTALLGVGALTAVLTARDWLRGLPLVVLGAMACYVLALALSATQSTVNPTVTATAVTDGLKELVFVAVLLALVTASPRRWRWPALATSLAAPLALVCVFAPINEWVLGNTYSFGGFDTVTTALGVGVIAARHAGPVPDANFWGRFLVLALPFALVITTLLWRRVVRREPRRSVLLALVTSGGIVAILLSVYLTGSRGTFLAAAVALAVLVFAAGVPLRRLWWVVPAGAAVFVVPGVGSRLLSTFSVSENAQRAGADGSVIERLATQEVALRMIEQSPLTGIGPGGYAQVFAREAATTDLSLTRVVAPHNLYLALWSESGILGLLTWLALVVTACCLAVRALRVAAASPDPRVAGLRPYAAAALAGIVAWSVASAFLHLTYARILLIVIVLAAVLDREARAATAAEPDVVHDVGAHRTDRGSFVGEVRAGAGWAVGAGVISAVVAVAAAFALSGGSRTTLSGWLVPVDDGTYALSLRTRTAVLPTFAVALGSNSRSVVDAQGDPSSGLVTLTASAPNGPAAIAQLEEVAAGTPSVLEHTGLDRLYTVRWSEVRVVPSSDRLVTVVLAGAGGGLLGALAGVLAAIRRIRPRPAWHDLEETA